MAEDVFAPQDVPESTTTNVDGYAVRCEYILILLLAWLTDYPGVHSARDPPGIYQVLSPSSWGDRSKPIPTGCIYRINTGAPIPVNCDAVVMVEDTELVSSVPDQAGKQTEEKEVKILVQVAPRENVRLPGSDAKQGDLVR